MPLTGGGARSRRALAALVLVGSLLVGSGLARAQGSFDQFDIERFRIAMDGSGILDVDGADVPGHKTWGLGLWLGFAHDPLVLYDPTMAPAGALVGQRLTTGLVGSIALWDRAQLGLAFDAVGYQAGSGTLTGVMGAELPAAGVADLRISTKILVMRDRRARFQLAIIPVLTVPLGGARGFLRDSEPAFAPELAGSWSLGALRAAANLGYRFRHRVEVADLVVDDEIFARAGLGVPIRGTGDHTTTELAFSASVAARARFWDAKANQTAIEVMAGGTQRVSRAIVAFAGLGIGLDKGFGTPDWRLVLGARVQDVRGDRDGDGIEDVADRCPNEPEDKDGFQDQDGCPEPDNDGDGIPDVHDRCPNEPEDKDGWEDEDGCPDPDNDGDGIPDAHDKCPLEPEDKDGFEDDDGCPDPSAKIEGQVVDANHRPVPAATVVVEQVDFPDVAPLEVTGADDGTFSAEVRGGAIKVTARVAGYQPGETTARATRGQATPITVSLARVVHQGQLRGQVLSFDGKPLSATITVSAATVTTDAEGMFTVDLPEGTFEAVIESKGQVTQRRTVKVKVDRVTVLNVDMRSGH